MKFSELLNKKKKTKMEENQTTENTEQKDILNENESVTNELPEIDENSTPPDVSPSHNCRMPVVQTLRAPA